MFQHLLVSAFLAAAPMMGVAQTGTASKPAAPQKAAPPPATTQKPGEAKPAAAASKGVRTVDIVGTDDMKFSVTNIDAKPGEQIRVRLMAKGGMPKIAMAHNFVLLALKANVLAFVNASAMARATDFIPAEMKKDVLAATALAGAGETVEVTFKAPSAAGTYNYICSFPGHFQAGMKGTLTVK